MLQRRTMLPDAQIWSELEPRLQAIHAGLQPAVLLQSKLGPDGGGPPLSRVVAYAATQPSPHWHFVTCGLSASRFIPTYPSVGEIELSFRLGRAPDEKSPPTWVVDFLQQLSRDAFSSEEPVTIEGSVNLETFWQQQHDTALTAGFYIEDPVVPAGSIRLVQLVALTAIERKRIEILSENRSKMVLELAPSGISDLTRERRAVPQVAAARPPPPPRYQPKLATVTVTKVDSRMRVAIAAEEIPSFVETIAASVRESRVTFESQGWTVHVAVEDIARSATWATTLMIYLTLQLSKQVSAELSDPARRGQPLRYAALPDLELFVVGKAVEKVPVLKRLGNFFGMP